MTGGSFKNQFLIKILRESNYHLVRGVAKACDWSISLHEMDTLNRADCNDRAIHVAQFEIKMRKAIN